MNTFSKVLLPTEEKLSDVQKRFLSCTKFVADEYEEVVPYLRGTWCSDYISKQLAVPVSKLSEISDKFGDHSEEEVWESRKQPALAFVSADPSLRHDHEKNLLVHHLKDEFLLSNDEITNAAQLADQGLTPQNAIVFLAALGVSLSLPNVSFEYESDHEIKLLKEELSEERSEYLEWIAGISEEAYDRLLGGTANDLIDWGEREVAFKIQPKVRRLQHAVKKANPRLLKSAKARFWKDGVPAIAQSALEGGIFGAGKATAIEILRSITKTDRNVGPITDYPYLRYILKIEQVLQKS